MTGGGQIAIRGFLAQTLIGVLDALDQTSEWESATLEPNVESEKVDILLECAKGTKAIQVKSSQNPFEKANVERWSAELEDWKEANEYELALVGTAKAGAVPKDGMIGKVRVPTPLNLNLVDLKERAAFRVQCFLESHALSRQDTDSLLNLVALLTEQFATGSVTGHTFTRDALVKLLTGWLPRPSETARVAKRDPAMVRMIRVFVSSPDDVTSERAVLDEVVASINNTEGQAYGVRLELIKWEENIIPQIGPGRQNVKDQQVSEYDIYLGIMSTRFGEPTGGHGSGTEKELNDALEKWKQAGKPWITFYFDAQPQMTGDPEQALQFARVCKFRSTLDKMGVVATYSGTRGSRDSLYEKVSDHLRKIVHRLLAPQRPPPDAEAAIPNSVEYYLRRLVEETKHLTMLGMGRSLQVELPIAEAYVPLRTTMARHLGAKETGRFQEDYADYEEVVDLGEVFRKAELLGQRGVVLLGEPGSGKTTGARQLVWRLASRKSTPEELGLPASIVPVFLRFRNLSRRALEQKTGLRAFLKEETQCDEAPEGCEMPAKDLWNRRGLLWVLDGLDEVIDPTARRKVSSWIGKTLKNRPDDWFVVTCRFQGYYRKGVPLGPKFIEFHVRPLDEPQVERFVRDWFFAAHGKLQGPGERAQTRAEADSSQLLEILTRSDYQTGHMRELCTNPLLLTILCIVFHEERKLPTGRPRRPSAGVGEDLPPTGRFCRRGNQRIRSRDFGPTWSHAQRRGTEG